MELEWLAALVTLTVMEIVLGIDNIIFIAILANTLPPEQARKARQLGIAAALVTRLLLLFSISWLAGLTQPLLTLPDLPFFHDTEAREISTKDLILILGGAFLIYKSVKHIHEHMEGGAEDPPVPHGPAALAGPTLLGVIGQIAVIDIIFSLDSVITAVGMARQLWVMVTAVVIAVGVMLLFAGMISEFVARHPTIKMLALSFLILIGVVLIADGFGQHIPKGYIYFAMAFSVTVELLNLAARHRREPVALHRPKLPAELQ
jgi:predicted tellurium resistance membrane protein TerC